MKPGSYYLYARVLWANAVGDSTYFGGDAWLGTAAMASRETARVILEPARIVFPKGVVPPRRFPRSSSDQNLPRLGEYVYAEQLAEVIRRVAPE